MDKDTNDFAIDKYNHDCLVANREKVRQEGRMKEVIESVRKLLKDGVFSDEQHVRFSLVGRICQKLGWNIWNPAEFFTEYKVEKVPTQLLPKDSNGRVDVALFLSDNKPKAAEVFMEIKAPGKLMPSLKDCEDQLHAYTGHHRIAIGILTDGVIWRFYVPAIGGYFKDTLFAQLNLEVDDIETIVAFFNDILHRDNFRKKAQDKAEQMFEELGRIILVKNVKQQAIAISQATGLSEYLIAQRLLKQNERIDMEIEEIQQLWNRTIPGGGTPPPPPPPPPPLEDCMKTFISAGGVKASGCYNTKTKQFILYKGSEVKKEHSNSVKPNYHKTLRQLINSGDLVLDNRNSKYILQNDKTFSASSSASQLVLGRSSSGLQDWRDENGVRLATLLVHK